MTADFDRMLRDAVHDLAGKGTPVDLAAPALRTAGRIRTRRTVSAVASLAVVVAGAVLVAGRFAGVETSTPPADDVIRNNQPPSATASPSASAPPPDSGASESPVVLPGGWMIRRAPGPEGGVVYVDESGRYLPAATGAQPTLPSPNGRYRVDYGQVLALTTMADGARKDGMTPPSPLASPVWAPDSSRIAFLRVVGRATHLVTIDTAGVERLSEPVSCSGGCTLKWIGNQRVRIYTGSGRSEVDVVTGGVGAPSATPDDPCGPRVPAYRIDSGSWLCVTSTGFATTKTDGSVVARDPLPTKLGAFPVAPGPEGYVLFQLK